MQRTRERGAIEGRKKHVRMAKHSTCAISKRELEEKYLTQEKCSPNRSGSRTSERPREEEGEGEGGREINKSTIGIYACISDERAGG